MMAALPVSSVILLLFRDVWVALLILQIAVFGISGSLLALLLTHNALNVGSYTGMIIGIIAKNAIFTFLQFKARLPETTSDEAVTYAVSTRLRPKLMTALGAIAALLLLALGIGAQLHQPLAIAVLGGFMITLPLLLIVSPAFLLLLFKKKSLVT